MARSVDFCTKKLVIAALVLVFAFGAPSLLGDAKADCRKRGIGPDRWDACAACVKPGKDVNTCACENRGDIKSEESSVCAACVANNAPNVSWHECIQCVQNKWGDAGSCAGAAKACGSHSIVDSQQLLVCMQCFAQKGNLKKCAVCATAGGDANRCACMGKGVDDNNVGACIQSLAHSDIGTSACAAGVAPALKGACATCVNNGGQVKDCVNAAAAKLCHDNRVTVPAQVDSCVWCVKQGQDAATCANAAQKCSTINDAQRSNTCMLCVAQAQPVQTDTVANCVGKN